MDDEENVYCKFIVMSDEYKEQIRNMSEGQLNFISMVIAENIRNTQMKIRQEMEDELHKRQSIT